jgi:hypothetical protein
LVHRHCVGNDGTVGEGERGARVGATPKRMQKDGDGVAEMEDQSFAHHRKSLVALDAGSDGWVDVG